jgi:16S rRNA C1402 N4-methylase RsmH
VRQGPDSSGLTAEEMVNEWDERELARVLRGYGEEPRAAKIARNIAAARPLATTGQLKEVVEKCVAFEDRGKTLARVFQVRRTLYVKTVLGDSAGWAHDGLRRRACRGFVSR